MPHALTPAGRGDTRHVFTSDLEELYEQLVSQAEAQGVRVLPVADLDVPSVALVVEGIGAFLDQAKGLGEGIVYLAPDELGRMLEEHIDVVDELRELIPPGESDEERETAAEMARSLLRLQELQNRLGTATFRLGYLRQGVFHEIVLEDDEAAPGAALADLTMHDELPEHEHGADLVPDR